MLTSRSARGRAALNIHIDQVTINNVGSESLAEQLTRIEGKVDALMATTAEVEGLLGQINTATTEVAEDIAALLARPEVPDSIRNQAQESLDRLRAVAGAYTPSPVDPGTVPGEEPLPTDGGGTGGGGGVDNPADPSAPSTDAPIV